MIFRIRADLEYRVSLIVGIFREQRQLHLLLKIRQTLS